jgi:putative DNA primase/helicase
MAVATTAPGKWLDAVVPTSLLDFTVSDDGNAERIRLVQGDRMRYSGDMKRWLTFTSSRWQIDLTGQAALLGKLALRRFLDQAIDTRKEVKFALKSLNDRNIMAALHMLQPELSIEIKQLDANPYLLNFLNGTLDIRDGVLRKHRREDYITKVIHHNYNPEATAHRWQQFIREIMNSDEEKILFLKRALGYSLTGMTTEKALFVPYGAGNNGKTTLLSLIREFITEYAVTIDVGVVLAGEKQRDSNILSALANLRGCRFAVTSETEKGQKLSPSQLKKITQGFGSEITACRKFENAISFPETHKLWIDTNDLPDIPNGDTATFARIYPIHFPATFANDKKLPETLRDEAEGILADLIYHAGEWSRKGLGAPAEIKQSRQEWHDESDQIQRFFHDKCIIDKNKEDLTAESTPLYDAYKIWCAATREPEKNVITHTRFGREMKKRGFPKSKPEKVWVYSGICLRSSDSESA